MYQPELCNHESLGNELEAKRIKMNDRTFKVSFHDLQNYLFEKRNAGVAIEYNKLVKKSTNQEISRLTKDMPNIVRLCLSSIPGTEYGVQATQTIPVGAWIGPYQGNFLEPDKANGQVDSTYLWEIFKDGKFHGYIDGSDENTASWMRFIRCARYKEEQNLYAFQYMNKIYYRTYKTIEPGQELLVWYDQMYTQYMGIPCEGIYDMASTNGTSHLSKILVEVTEDKAPLTPPTTPTKPPYSSSTPQSLNVASSTNKTPVRTSPSASRASGSSLQPIKRLEFPEDRIIATDNETRKRPFGPRQIKIDDQQSLPNQNTDMQISITAMPRTMDGETEMASVQQLNGLPTNTGKSQARDFTASPPPNCVKPGIAQPQSTQLQCGQCKKVFIQRSVLQTHTCAGVLLKPYQCGHCNKTFSNPVLMRLHAVTHRGKKPFKCGYCMRSFSGATTLNNHIRTHTGEKPFDCLKCGKSFTKGLQLSRHHKMPGDCAACS